MNADVRFMSEALALAEQGRGSVEPNPMVGAIVVRDDVESGRGWHRKFGGPHAEIEALQAAKRAGDETCGATMYVTLEPCCHHGKTSACTEAIIAARIGRVVVAMIDPDRNVSGKGVQALRAAGIRVDVGVCEQQARKLLAAYVKLRTQGVPWVICKWAQTADGVLALPAGRGRWVSGEQSRRRAHEIRALTDGICVGIGTVLADDPLLTNRSGGGKQPVRVVLDTNLRSPPDCRLASTAGEFPLLIVTSQAALAGRARHADELRKGGAEVLAGPTGPGGVDLSALLDELGRRQWTYLLVEGGPAVLRSFIDAGLTDELLVFVSAQQAGPGEDLPRLDVQELAGELGLGEGEASRLGADTLLRFVLTA